MTNWHFETKQIHAAQQPDSATRARALPIYQTTAYVFDDCKQAAGRFALSEGGPIYTRLNNPTNEVVETRIAELEGGQAGLIVASGAGALTLTFETLGSAGTNIVASGSLYGGTLATLANNLPRFGITTRFVANPADPDEWKRLADADTIAFFGETIPNPRGDVLDIEAVAEAAHACHVPLVVDNTVATPYLSRPIEWGADIVVHSASKYLGGHGVSILGAIVDAGNFDWSVNREFTTPDDSYHGLRYADLGAGAFIAKARVQGVRDFGWAASPFNAWTIALGLETLSLRMERHCANAQEVARYLEAHTHVSSVNYPGLASSPYRKLADKYLPRGCASVLSFDLGGTREEGERFVDALQLHSNVANLGDVRSLVAHPASTTHSQCTTAQLQAAGITPGTVRLSVGIEHIDDIIADLELGFAAIGADTGRGR